MIFTVYLFKKFSSLFAGALVFASFALMLVDLFMNLSQFLINEVPFSRISYLMLLYIPKTMFFSVPFAVLFAACFSLSDLYANNELIAIYAAGISLFKFTRSLILFSFVLSFGLFAFENYIVVPTYAKKVALQDEFLNRYQSPDRQDLVVIADGGNTVYKADNYDDAEQRLDGLYIIIRNADKSLNAILRANYADWQDGSWSLRDATQYSVSGGYLVNQPVDSALVTRLTEPPETFRNNTISVETVNVSEAKTYIDKLRRSGLPISEATSIYYKKFAFPFIVFIVVFLSVGLSGKTRKNVLLISLVLCIGSAVLFYVMQLVTMTFAGNGKISPIAGAWSPVIFFTALSVILLKYAKT
jgi:lipopolysaccharide export system permease protein